MAALPPHMRRPKVCERRYPDFRVVVRIDGETALDQVVAAGGARKDRAPQLLGLARSLAELREDPENARRHGERNRAAVRAILERFGQQLPLIVGSDDVIRVGN